MKVDEVTVLNVDGQLLASGSDSMDSAPDNLLALQKNVSRDVRDTIVRTLAPYLSVRNFQVSVAARLNADKMQTNETLYNPDGRAERSVRVTKEKQNSQNSSGTSPAGVEANLPKPKNSSGDAKQSQDATEKKEELTNYEISSKSISTTSEGYVVKGLSVAVLINRAALVAALGDKPSQEAIDAQVKEIEQLVTSAAGLQKDRGDFVKIAVMDFADSGKELEPVSGPSFLEILERQTGTLVGALAVLIVGGVLIAFGVRPLVKALLAPNPAAMESIESAAPAALEGPDFEMRSAFGDDLARSEDSLLLNSDENRDSFLDSLKERRERGPQQRLHKLISFDEEHAAQILKQWINQGTSG
jgi:flagellar M-ring protein FliF